MTPYEVLGVEPGASAGEVRRAYLALARRNHPDVVPAADRAAAEQRMRAINEAWAVLGDPERRRRYDATTGGAARAGFRPFRDQDEGDDAWRHEPDVPYGAGTTVRRPAALAPALLLVAGLALASLAAVLRVTPLLGAAVVLLVLGSAGFLVLPLLALGRARRDEG